MTPVDRRTALAALGALALAPTPVAAQTTPVPIHAGHPPTETAAPALYAIRAGLFERAGIALTIDKMSSGAAVAAAVAGGGLDLGGGGEPDGVAPGDVGDPVMARNPSRYIACGSK